MWSSAPVSNRYPNAPPLESFAAPSSTSTWWVGASSTDGSAMPNTGVRGVIQVISLDVSGCLSFWVSDGTSNGNWGQVGYYICNGSTPQAFYQVWNLNTQTILAGGTTAVSPGYHTFSMYLQSGTTWAYSLDGNVFGSYDMGTSSSSSTYPVYALSEEQGSAVFSFPTVTFTTAMQVLRSGTWSAVQSAQSYGAAWGTMGAVQGGGLKNDQIEVGTSLAALAQGTLLWGGGSSTTTSSASASSTTSFPPVTTTSTATITDTTFSTRTSTVTYTTTVTQTNTPSTSTTTGGGKQTVTETVTTTRSVTVTQSSSRSVETVTTTVTVTSSVGFPPTIDKQGTPVRLYWGGQQLIRYFPM